MESTERLVRTWVASGRDEELHQLVSDINSGSTTLLNIVKALGEYLTSEEDVIRGKGVDLLSRLLEHSNENKINSQATRVLVTFYAGKLEDEETVIPALKGLLRLSSLPTFTGADVVDTFRALFSHVKMKSLNQTQRYLVYQLLDSLLARKREVLKENNDQFLTGYIALLDGEKDPRNLLLAFAMDQVICIEFDISRHVQDLFDIIFCYFPITFRPPPDDPYGITADDLRASLRTCLRSNPLFGKLAVPLFCDKLLASSPMTKKDIIETIGVCLPVYGRSVARKGFKSLWNFLKMEIFQPVNSEIEQEALNVTQILISAAYQDASATTDAGDQGLVNEIIDECLELMGQPEKTQAIPATKTMSSLIGTTREITELVLTKSIPFLMKLFRDPGEAIHRPRILTLLCVIVTEIKKKLQAIVDLGLQTLLLSFKDDILGAFIAGIKNAESSEAALEGIKDLSQMEGVLTEEELVYIVSQVNELLQADLDQAELASDEALAVLISIAESNSKVVEEHSLPILFNSLPDKPPPRDAHGDRARYWATLRWLARLCIPAPLFETLVIRLTTKLELICAIGTASEDDTELRAAYAHSILRTLESILELKSNAGHADVPKYIDTLIPKLYGLFLAMALEGNALSASEFSTRLLPVAGHIITIVVRLQSADRQAKLASDLRNMYFDGKFEFLGHGKSRVPVGAQLRPLENSATATQRDTMYLLSSAVVGFHKDVFFPDLDKNNYLINLQCWVLEMTDEDMQATAAYHITSSLLNKEPAGLQTFVASQIDTIWASEINNGLAPIARRRKAIESWLWLVQPIIVRGDERKPGSNVWDLVTRLFGLIEDEDVGRDAARVIGRIPDIKHGVLTKANHSTVRPLFAQKYFKSILPMILDRLGKHGDQNYLIALTSLISSLPKTTYVNDMPLLMPHLVRGLGINDPAIQESIIDTLCAIASKGETSTQEHATSLVSTMLSLTNSASPMSLRIAALRYLAVLPKTVRYDILHPQKSTVLRQLNKSLDDSKKVVRKEAVDARTAWFLYKG